MSQPPPTIAEHQLPGVLNVPAPNDATISLVRESGARVVAEIGVYEGATSAGIARVLAERDGELHLFDFQDRVEAVIDRLAGPEYAPVIGHGNTRKIMDSYNWTLGRLLAEPAPPAFDYVFLDGAHLWGIDALAFFLADRLLSVGGIIDFDDFDWSLAASETMNPSVFPATADLHTQEQIESRQVALVVDLVVRSDPRYEEILPNKAFRKRA
ncbi:MAG: class I SAM-dependent methyltransferase [Ornithinimicrobium sp.]|uniref:class I SAM-dependent methyltransferase n=1 Tax=Ornithinimicrobium sp. TaxID=1977084 RepID=UPI003D9B3631